MVRIGAHVSSSKSLDLVFDRAIDIGADTIQFFLNSPRSWKTKTRTEQEIEDFHTKKNKYKIKPTVVHASYLYNLASEDKHLREKSIKGVINDLHLCEELDIDYYVIHPGKAKGQTEQQAIEHIKRSLDYIFSKTQTKTVFLLETLAGQKGEIGKTTQELKELLEAVPDQRAGICIDTCHIFSAGYRINTEEGFDAYKTELEALIGLDRVKLIHCNDSKTPFNSRKDRHQHIGEGYIGIKGFEIFLNDSYLGKLPYIIETPKVGNYDQINIEKLRKTVKYAQCVRSSNG
ncbi:MAG: deoxyribonuclease IV [Aquificae bacterium]|nr:deoxyribonuclease IV [Aquificota bacterium]